VLALFNAVQNSLGNYYHYEVIKTVCEKLGNLLKCNMSGEFALLLLVDFKFVNYFKKNRCVSVLSMIFPHFTEKKFCKISLYISSSRYVIDIS